MGHDGALRQKVADDPTRRPRMAGGSECGRQAISPVRRATMARSNPVVELHEEAPMEEAPVLVERRAGYRVITLNRPRQLNAFNEAMHQALKRALAEAEEDADCRALLLTGAGRAFCAGQDLRDRITPDGKTTVLGDALDIHYNPLVRKLLTLPFPVVASCWRRARRPSCRPSSRSASSPIAGARGSCRGWSVPPARAGLRLRPSRFPRTRPKPGASFGKRSTTSS